MSLLPSDVCKDILLLAKARVDIIRDQMAEEVPHEVLVEHVHRDEEGVATLVFRASEAFLWDPFAMKLVPYGALHTTQTGARNALVALGYTEVLDRYGEMDGHGRFQIHIPLKALQACYYREVN